MGTSQLLSPILTAHYTVCRQPSRNQLSASPIGPDSAADLHGEARQRTHPVGKGTSRKRTFSGSVTTARRCGQASRYRRDVHRDQIAIRNPAAGSSMPTRRSVPKTLLTRGCADLVTGRLRSGWRTEKECSVIQGKRNAWEETHMQPSLSTLASAPMTSTPRSSSPNSTITRSGVGWRLSSMWTAE